MKLTWDDIGSRLYKTGIDRGVLYPIAGENYQNGVAWSGLTGIDDTSSGNEKTPLYNDDRKRSIVFNYVEPGGTIKCYTYPDAFDPCIGNEEISLGVYSKGQNKSGFGLSYRTKIGNDIDGANYAYEIHVIYNCMVTGSKENAATISGDANIGELNFTFESLFEDFDYGDPVSHLVINSRFADAEKLTALENILYGTVNSSPRLPRPDEIYDLLYVPPEVPDWYVLYPHDGRYPSSEIYSIVPLITVPSPPEFAVSRSGANNRDLRYSVEVSGNRSDGSFLSITSIEVEFIEENYNLSLDPITIQIPQTDDFFYQRRASAMYLSSGMSNWQFSFKARCRYHLSDSGGGSYTSEWSSYTNSIVV